MNLSSTEIQILETPFKDIEKMNINTRECLRDVITPEEITEKRMKIKNLKFPGEQQAILAGLIKTLKDTRQDLTK